MHCVALACLICVCTVGVPSVAHPVVRVVRHGDCLSEIAVEYDVSVDQLQSWNKLSGDRIYEGQRLVVKNASSKRTVKSSGPRRSQYRVKSGDTLSDIAARHSVDLDDLISNNPGIDADHIAEGQQLSLPSEVGGRYVSHSVRRGETLSDIARRYMVSVRDILRWNDGVRPQALSVRQPIKVISKRRPPSESIGLPWDGRLENGRRLEPHKGYSIRDPNRSWGTEETVESIRQAFDEVRRHHKRAPRIPVHDLSRRNGGPIDDHRSHESGRDADIAYFQRRCPRGVCSMRNILPRQLLVGPQWTLLRSWIRRGQAQVIFIDYSLQAALYRHARLQGATPRQLTLWFQYPRPRSQPVGIIRHYPNHRNHLHVRFVCSRGDRQCQ